MLRYVLEIKHVYGISSYQCDKLYYTDGSILHRFVGVERGGGRQWPRTSLSMINTYGIHLKIFQVCRGIKLYYAAQPLDIKYVYDFPSYQHDKLYYTGESILHKFVGGVGRGGGCQWPSTLLSMIPVIDSHLFSLQMTFHMASHILLMGWRGVPFRWMHLKDTELDITSFIISLLVGPRHDVSHCMYFQLQVFNIMVFSNTLSITLWVIFYL